MVTEFLTYDLKVAVLMAVFYFCYRLLMERDTMHRINRVVLLVGLALSFVLPLCVITLHETVWMEKTELPSTESAIVHSTRVTTLGQSTSVFWDTITWQHLLAIVVIAGMVLRLFYIIRSYRQLQHLLNRSERHTMDDIEVAVTDEPTAPFSWMKTIVVNRHDHEEHNPLLLIHERSHIRLHHSWDIVFVELLSVLQWFNPVVWLMSRDLRTLHEYEADEAVLSQGFDTAQYISLLMAKATGIQACVLANGINTSEIKKRIDMMIKRKSPRLSWLKGLYVVPIAVLSLAMTAKTVTDYRALPNRATDNLNEGKGISRARIMHINKVLGAERHKERLVVVDGKELSQEEFENMNLVKEDIAWVDVLGVSSAKKIYGNRGRYGATIIKTMTPPGNYVGVTVIDGKIATKEEYNGLLKNKNVTFEKFKMSPEEAQKKYGVRGKNGAWIITTKQAITSDGADGVFDICEEMPRFPGGEAALMKFIAMNVKYPKEATEWGVMGRVIVKFIVEKDGRLTEPKVVKTTDLDEPSDIAVTAYRKDMTEEQLKDAEAQDSGIKAGAQAIKDEAVRVVKMMPNWEPGKQNGQPVRVYYSIPITFRLN